MYERFYIARHSFISPSTGANKININFWSNDFGDYEHGEWINLRYYIGTSPTSHINANINSSYTGTFTFDKTHLKFTAELDYIFSPNTTYYIWVFPAETTYGWYYWPDE
jgi:hypothetical protein